MPLVRPLKNAEGGEYEEPVNPVDDGVAAKGFYPQNSSSIDENAGIERDGSGYMQFKDPKSYTTKMVDWLLANEPNQSGITYELTRTGDLVDAERWEFTSSGLAIKTIDYTRTSGLLSQEVVKVYGSDGTTIVAQVTITYSRSGGVLTGSTRVRNV